MKRTWMLGLVALGLFSAAWSATRVKMICDDPILRNVVTITSQAPLETIVTRTQQVVGDLDFDVSNVLANPKASFSLDVDKLDTGIPMRNGHMKGKMWLDAETYPKITFELKELHANAPMLALEPRKSVDLDALATVSIHGVAKDLPVRVTLTWIPGDADTLKHLPGDWLKVDANWDILLTDFGVKLPVMAQASVSDRQHVEAHIIASTQKAVAKP